MFQLFDLPVFVQVFEFSRLIEKIFFEPLSREYCGVSFNVHVFYCEFWYEKCIVFNGRKKPCWRLLWIFSRNLFSYVLQVRRSLYLILFYIFAMSFLAKLHWWAPISRKCVYASSNEEGLKMNQTITYPAVFICKNGNSLEFPSTFSLPPISPELRNNLCHCWTMDVGQLPYKLVFRLSPFRKKMLLFSTYSMYLVICK